MYSSLRQYVNFLETKGELIRISEFTDPVYEITKLTDAESKKPGGGKALLFENTGTSFPVITNMMGSQRRIQYALGISDEEGIDAGWASLQNRIDSIFSAVLKERSSFTEKLKLLPTIVEASKWLPKHFSGKAPCQQAIESTIDISTLPILKCWPLDGGRFITLPMVHTQDPSSGSRNVGMYRMQVFDQCTTGMHWHRHKTGARHYDLLREMILSERLSPSASKLPVAVTLGGDPAYTYAATAPLPDGLDEYLLAGFLRNEAVQMVDCITQPLSVPSDCDFVIEGYVDVSEAKVVEGPFGDHTGFYSLEGMYPLFHITCITHRSDAIYPATIVGIPPMEDKYFALATEKIFLSPIRFAIAPEILDLFLPEEGVGHNFGIVKIKKSYPGQANKIASALWGAGQMMFNKFLLIVSDDINIRDFDAVKGVLQKNYLPSRDTLISKGPLDILDHTAPVCGYGGKMSLDATHKLPEEIYSPLDDALTCNIIVTFNSRQISLFDCTYEDLWRLGGNCDPARDSHIDGNTLYLDARIKKGIDGFNREWPEEVRF